MIRFLNGVLQGIDRLFDLEGSRNPTDSLEVAPLQVVHDASTGVLSERIDQLTRNALTNFGPWRTLPRFFIYDRLEIPSNGNTFRSSIDPFQQLLTTQSLGHISIREIELWLLDCYAWTGTGGPGLQIDIAQHGIRRASLNANTTGVDLDEGYTIKRFYASDATSGFSTSSGVALLGPNQGDSQRGKFPDQLFWNEQRPGSAGADELVTTYRALANAAAGRYVYSAFELVVVPRNLVNPLSP